MENKELRELFQERFDSFEPEPSRDLWSGIEDTLRPKRRMLYWPYLAAAAAVLLLLIAGIWMAGNRQGRQELPIAKQEQGQPVPSPTPEEAQPVPVAPQTPDLVAQEASTDSRTRKEGVTLSPDPLQTRFARQTVTQLPKGPEKDEVIQEMIAMEPKEAPVRSLDLPFEGITNNLQGLPLSDKPIHDVFYPLALETEMQATSPTVRRRQGSLRNIDLNHLSSRSLSALAADGLEKLGVPSPIKVEEQEDSKGKYKSVKIGFGLFNITHKRSKQYIIKKPDA